MATPTNASVLETNEQILSKVLKFDRNLKTSNDIDSIREIIIADSEHSETEEQYAHELMRNVSIPNNYVFAFLANRIYNERTDGTDGNGQSLHGVIIDPSLGKWQLLTVAFVESRIVNGYFGGAYWNPDMQQVIIVHCGTCNFGGGLTDLESVYLNKHVIHINSAITFTEKIIAILKEIKGINEERKQSRTAPYIQLFFTGHSLGAWLAQITTFTAKYTQRNGEDFVASKDLEKNIYDASAVVFDSPGCKSMLQRIQDRLISRLDPSLINTLNITTFVTAPNLVNACNLHVGDVYKVFAPFPDSIDLLSCIYDIKAVPGKFLNHFFFMHSMDKIRDVFNPETGEVRRNEDGSIRLKKVIDWPCLVSENENAVFLDIIVGFINQATNFEASTSKAATTWDAYVTYPTKNCFFELRAELKNFYKLAVESNEFHLGEDDTNYRVGENIYRIIRYKTKNITEKYKKESNVNAFTRSQRQFLEIYKHLTKYEDSPGVSSTATLLHNTLGDQSLVEKSMQMLKDYDIVNETVFSEKLPEFIPYIKRMLDIFPRLNVEIEKAHRSLPIERQKAFFKSASSSIMEIPMEFKNDILDLDYFLSSDTKVLHVIQPDISIWSAIILKTLSILNNGKVGYHVFYTVNRMFYLWSTSGIRFLEDITERSLLVIECDRVLDNQLDDFFKYLFGVLKNNPLLKIIFVTRTKEQELIERTTNTNNDLKDSYALNECVEVKLTDLTDGSRKELLKKKIIFQGNEIPLNKLLNANDLDTIVDPETIIALVKNENVEIGKALPTLGQSEDYYIDRTIIRNEKIKESVFKEENFPDSFAVSNTTKEDFSKLVDEEVCNFLDIRDGESNFPKFVVLNGEHDKTDFEKLCPKLPQSNRHWLKKEGNDFIWQKTHGSITNIRQNLDISVPNSFKIDSVNNFKARFIVIAAEPGMGKSTALTYLGMQHIGSDWLIRINLAEHRRILEDDIDFTIVENIVDFLHASNGDLLSSRLTKKLMLSRFKDDNNIVLFLDGFDEIAHKCQENVKNLLEALQKTNIKKVIIAARWSFCTELEDILPTLAHTFQPFSEDDQKTFLKKFFQNALVYNNKEPQIDDFNIYIDKLLEFISHSIRDKERKFMGIPLQMKMIAEAFQDELEHSCVGQSDNEEFVFPKEFDIFKLYDRFIQTKYQIYFSKINVNIDFNDDVQSMWFTSRIRIIHGSTAFRALFPEIDDYFFKDKYPSETEKNAMKLVGLVQYVNNEFVFMHHTFAEYFVANFLADNLKHDENSEVCKITLNFLAKQLFESGNQVIKVFLDYHLAKEEVHFAAFKGKLEGIELAIADNTLHTTDILGRSALHYAAQEEYEDIIKLLLDKDANVSAADKLGRTALHYAARYNCGESVVTCLLEKDSNCINIKDKNEYTPIAYSAAQDNWIIVELLVKEDADAASFWQGTFRNFYTACKSKLKFDRALTEEEACIGRGSTSLRGKYFMCLTRAKLAMTPFLTDRFLNACTSKTAGRRIAIYGEENRYWNTAVSLIRNNSEFKVLVDAQKIDLVNYCIQYCYWDIVARFLEGANYIAYLNLLSDDQKKGELLSFCVLNGNFDITKLLVESGVDVNTSDRKGNKPISHAVRKNYVDIAEFILQKGGKPTDLHVEDRVSFLNFCCKKYFWDMVDLLMKDKEFYLLENEQQLGCLYHYIAVGDLSLTKCCFKNCNRMRSNTLLDKINFPDNDGSTVLHYAIVYGQLDIAQYLIDEERAELNAQDKFKLTPLHLAVQNNKVDAVRYLVEKGADLTITNASGKTAEDFAVERKETYTEIVNILEGVRLT